MGCEVVGYWNFVNVSTEIGSVLIGSAGSISMGAWLGPVAGIVGGWGGSKLGAWGGRKAGIWLGDKIYK